MGTYEALLTNHTVDVDGTDHAGVRWYEINNPGGSPFIFQQWTLMSSTGHLWMGSTAMDRFGDVALGYSASSSTIFPSLRYTGRLASDPLGTLEAENTIKAGTGSQQRNLSRWGDYSAITVDPTDDCTFFYTNEYLKANGTFNWSTWIASFKFPNCQ